MPSFYTYLISSLPVLRFNQKPPFSLDNFLEKCTGLIPDNDLEVLRKIPSLEFSGIGPKAIKGWIDFDTTLRNELVKIRSSRKKINPQMYLRPDGFAWPYIYHIALAAHRHPSPLEAERMLDEARWEHLEQLSVGHYFDLDFLVIYAYKLLILERWERIGSADATLLEKVVSEN
jgi:hypothetical protein